MAGLLDFLDSDQARLGMGLLAAAGPTMEPMNFGQRLFGAMNMYRGQKNADEDRALKREYMQAQMGNITSESEARKLDAYLKLAAIQKAAQQQEALAGLVPQQRTNIPQGFDMQGAMQDQQPQQTATGTPLPGVPAPTFGRSSQIDPQSIQRAIAMGVDPKTIEAMVAAPNWGRPTIREKIETTDEKGQPVTRLLSEQGDKIGEMPRWIPPVPVGQGDRNTFVNPVTMQPVGSFGINMSQAERDASARGWAGNGLAERRFAWDQSQAGLPKFNVEAGGFVVQPSRDSPQGGVIKLPGFTKPMTEAQANANIFAKRAEEASSIIGDLEGKYSRVGIAAKQGLEGVWGVGGALGAGTNFLNSDLTQRAEQAQNDFINAVLRKESGAAISKSEFETGRRQYFPQPGDSPAVVEQKRLNREREIEGMREAAGAGLQPSKVPKSLPMNPSAKNLEKGVVYQTPRGPMKWDGMVFQPVGE